MKPVVLIILDGWGIAPAGPGNAVRLASLPNFNRLWASFPHTQLLASGEPVGLPHSERGNSETGHLNLGAGRIIYQDLPRINMSIADGSFFKNPAFLDAITHVKENNSKLHLIGLIGGGGVHSSNNHLYALLRMAKEANLGKNLFLHLFTDGRDSPPSSAIDYLKQVELELVNIDIGKIATIVGRYYALDRDQHWERTQKAYEALVQNRGLRASSGQEAILAAYDRGKTDEFIEPTVITKEDGTSIGSISDNDAVIFFNFRIDRPRQLTKAFVLPDIEKLLSAKQSFDPYAEKYYKKTYSGPPQPKKTFPRERLLSNLCFVTMTEYEKGLPVTIAFPPITVPLPLARILSENNLRQLHISETEKERFVTYYFNGQREDPNPAEDWNIVPSPNVPTYDLQPSMSAVDITKIVIERLNSKIFNFILINFANPDMVGHTGVIPAGVTACEVVDECLGKIVNTVLAIDGSCIITADHGNVEEMIDPITCGVDTEHSKNPVPFIVVSKQFEGNSQELPSGILADVAPTILKFLNIKKPTEFLGRELI
jgi:2,3-bisphosphoglycerate-independent phosphoglycerate mutase